MVSEQKKVLEVFFSYAHKDQDLRDQLETHLSLLKHQGFIANWHDRKIIAGTEWDREIDTHLNSAQIILLLISADFLASPYCYDIEVKRAMEMHNSGEARVIPIILRHCDWHTAPFGKLQALPTDGKPVESRNWYDKDEAFYDITQGIRKAVADLQSLETAVKVRDVSSGDMTKIEVKHTLPITAGAPSAALPPIWNIPYPRNPFFLGRDEILVHLHHLLQANQTTALSQPQAVSGLGGIGKTQLALEYAYRYHQDYQAVLWAHAESHETLVSSYISLASLLHLPEREAKEQEITVLAVKNWLQAHRGWLLVLDNADDLTILYAFVPPVPGGHLLLTTRATATGRLAHRIEIEILTPKQGALFFLRRSGLLPPDATLEDASPHEQSLAIQLSRELGGLPLALDQAGAYVEQTSTNLVEYWQLYQQYRADLLQQRGGLVSDHPSSVATTWLVSFQRVEERNQAAADLLRLLAWLPPDGIAEEILPAGASFLGPVLALVAENGLLRNQAIEALRAYSFIQRDSKERMLSMHRLVQAVLRDRQDEVERCLWIERMILTINAAFPAAHEFKNWPQCERLLPSALLAAQWSETYQISRTEVGRLLLEMATYLRDRARYAEAEPLYQRALLIWEQQVGSEHPYVASTLDGLANLYFFQGKHEEAEPRFQRALRIWKQQVGPDDPQVAYLLNNMANLYTSEGKYAEAELLYQRALRIVELQMGSEDVFLAQSLNNLAYLYFVQGKYAEAEPLYQRALLIYEQLFGPEHPYVAFPLIGLADLYAKQGKYTEAEPLYQRALHIRQQQLGLEHSATAVAISGLAILREAQGNLQEALPLYQRALSIQDKNLGPDHPETRETHQRLTALQQSISQEDSLPERHGQDN